MYSEQKYNSLHELALLSSGEKNIRKDTCRIQKVIILYILFANHVIQGPG